MNKKAIAQMFNARRLNASNFGLIPIEWKLFCTSWYICIAMKLKKIAIAIAKKNLKKWIELKNLSWNHKIDWIDCSLALVNMIYSEIQKMIFNSYSISMTHRCEKLTR